MSLGMKVCLKDTGKVHDVYAIIFRKPDKQKIYLIKGRPGATRISLLIKGDEHSLLELSAGMDPEEKISDDYKWVYEYQFEMLHPESNEKALPFLIKETW